MGKSRVIQETIKRTLKAVQAAGLPVVRVEVDADGTPVSDGGGGDG